MLDRAGEQGPVGRRDKRGVPTAAPALKVGPLPVPVGFRLGRYPVHDYRYGTGSAYPARLQRRLRLIAR